MAKKKRTGGGRAYHSVLEPHQERIRQLRRQRLTWKEIAERLAAECGLCVTLHAVYRFCRRRGNWRPSWEHAARTQPEPEVQTPELESPDPQVPAAAPPVTDRRPYFPVSSFRRPDTQSFKEDDYL